MKAEILLAGLLAAGGCASGPRSGPTRDGWGVAVKAREKNAARREALEALLPLFLTDGERREGSRALAEAVFSETGAFVGREKTFPKAGSVVEVRVDALAAALKRAGLGRPRGFSDRSESVLIALGDRARGASGADHLAAEALGTALFSRGLAVHDVDDPLLPAKSSVDTKTDAGLLAGAQAGGWGWLAVGQLEAAASPEPQAEAWRVRANLTLSLYAVAGATSPVRVSGGGEAVDVSSAAAMTRAVDEAAQDCAKRVESSIVRSRAGRVTMAVLLSGYKNRDYVRRVVRDLRGIRGVSGASLASWSVTDERLGLIRVYAKDLSVDELAARLLQADSSLRVDGIETADNRLTLAGPDTPESEDRGD